MQETARFHNTVNGYLKNTSIEELLSTHPIFKIMKSNKGAFIYCIEKCNEVLSTSNRIKYSVGQQNH